MEEGFFYFPVTVTAQQSPDGWYIEDADYLQMSKPAGYMPQTALTIFR